MKKYFLSALVAICSLAVATGVQAQETYVSDRQELEIVSDRFGEDGPLTAYYYASTERISLAVDIDHFDDSDVWAGIPYPQAVFLYTKDVDGVHTGADVERYTGHSFDAVDGVHTIDFARRTTAGGQMQWYDRITFTLNKSDYADITPENYKVTVNHIILDNEQGYTSHPVSYQYPRYDGAKSTRVSVDDTNTGSFISTVYRGSTFYEISENILQLVPEDERFVRLVSGWKLESISGENCDAQGVYTAGPGLTTTCNLTYSYEDPYPSLIAENEADRNIVQTIVVSGGDRSARDIYEATQYKVSGTELETEDIENTNAMRVVGRIVLGCGRTGCSYNYDTGTINVPDYPDYTIAVSGTNCDEEGYRTGEGVGLTECVFTYTHIGNGEGVDEPQITLDVDIIGGPLQQKNVIISRRCGDFASDADPEMVSLSADGTATIPACYSPTGSLIESEYFAVKLYNDETYYYQAGYRETHIGGENCAYGSYKVKNGYNGEPAQDAACNITLTYEGGDNYDPIPGDECIITSTTDASGGIYGYNYATQQGCMLNPIDDGEEVTEEEEVTAGECIDTDGNGWGWDGEKGCKVEAEAVSDREQCIADGGVYNTELGKCFEDLGEQEESEAGECIDTDGNGWGWDGEKGCKVVAEELSDREQCIADGGLYNTELQKCFTTESEQEQEEEESEVGECIDTDGNGWGWDGEKGCQVEVSEQAQEEDQEESDESISHDYCSVTYPDRTIEDNDHNGWGDVASGEEGCKMDLVTNDDEEESESEEESEAGECIDTDGNGWGWDGEKGCKV